jgi:predicted nucleic acid-binding protein
VSRIYWDTMLFVYWLEDHALHAPTVQAIFERIRQRGDVLHTSTFTLGELLVGPIKQGASQVASQTREFFKSPEVTLISLNEGTAERYAAIRAAHRVSPADAIHLASAAEAGTDLFLTNDKRLRGLLIPGIHFIAGMDADLL